MIPKIIHYCWFGRNPKSKLALKCIESWKKFCPDYNILEWNEDNYNVYTNGYTEMCYKEKKWAYLSDYVRLIVVAQYGGLYFDTDVELIHSPNCLLENSAFFGFENSEYIASGLGFGSVPKGKAIKEMISAYDDFLSGRQGTAGCPTLNTKALEKHGLIRNGHMQTVLDAVIYPSDYFNPYDDPTGKLRITNNTISIHWYAKSALSKSAILKSKLTRPFHRLFGNNCFDWLKI